MAKSSSQKSACDRCRGQKLRCIWDPKEPQCQRCARANAVCNVPLPRPMGRPPRQYRSASSHSRGQTQSLYSWSEENPTAPVSGDEDTDIPLSSVNALSDPLDFLPWFPEPDGLNLFAPRGPITPTVTTAPAMSNPSATVNSGRPFSPQNEIFVPTLHPPSGGKLVESSGTNNRGLDEDDPMHFTTTEKGDEQIQLLTQLCQLNVALFQHPLHRERDKAALRTTIAPENTTQTSVDGQSAENGPPSPLDMNVGDLRTGNLFEMTCRLKDIITRIRAQDESAPQGSERYDRSTALMALSCYTRLEVLYSRALEILMRVRNSGPILDGTHRMMPELIIDGFSMGRCLDLQLNFLIHLHEQARERIRSCIRSAEGTTRVGRDRQNPSRSGQQVQAAPARYGS